MYFFVGIPERSIEVGSALRVFFREICGNVDV